MINSLFLRDAGCILPYNEKHYLKRLKRASELCRQFGLNIQLTLDHHYFFREDTELERQILEIIEPIPLVLIHLHTDYSLPFGNNTYTAKCIEKIHRFAQRCPRLSGICVHPDLISHFDIWHELRSPSFYFALEVMGENTFFGHRFHQIRHLLTKYPYFQLVLDTAHIMEMEHRGEPGLDHYINNFADRISEIQISHPGNLYTANDLPGMTTEHSLLHLGPCCNDIIDSLTNLPHTHKVIEGVIPPGKNGETLLANEMELLEKIYTTEPADKVAWGEKRFPIDRAFERTRMS